ncbi:MAG: hypothetical protein J0626_11440, partial [Rhodospirillaceae bacterium]|nr:hypothetical protein [Rhodospirillaceae bacterium]
MAVAQVAAPVEAVAAAPAVPVVANYRDIAAQPRRRLALMRAVVDRLKLQDLLEARELKARLAQAGWRGQAAPLTYIFSQVALPVVLLAFGLVYATTVFAHLPVMNRALILVGAMAAGAYLPKILLANAIQKRQHAVARAFP